jgi:hypothetical protein
MGPRTGLEASEKRKNPLVLWKLTPILSCPTHNIVTKRNQLFHPHAMSKYKA